MEDPLKRWLQKNLPPTISLTRNQWILSIVGLTALVLAALAPHTWQTLILGVIGVVLCQQGKPEDFAGRRGRTRLKLR